MELWFVDCQVLDIVLCVFWRVCRLQDEYTRAQNELKRLISDRQVAQEKQQLLLAELRGELLDKTRELEELRLQVHTINLLELEEMLVLYTHVYDIFFLL